MQIFIVIFNSLSIQRFQGMEVMTRAKMLKEIHLTFCQVMVMFVSVSWSDY